MSVYFVQIGNDGPIKIGDSDNVEVRIRSLQTGVPWTLRLLRVIPDMAAWRVYHDFSASRMKGEWFYPTRELLEFIANPYELESPDPYSWRRSRRRAGTNLTFIRRIIDLCEDHALASGDA